MTYWTWLIALALSFCPLQAQDIQHSQDQAFEQRLKLAVVPAVIKPLLIPLIDCPFDVAVMNKQVGHQSYNSILQHTYNTYGFKGFYQGFMAKFFSTGLKNLNSWIIYAFAPELFNAYFPSSYKTYYGFKEGIASFSIAFINMLFQTPLERFQVLQVTNPYQNPWDALPRGMIRELYRGSLLSFQQNFFSMFIFFMMEKELRREAQRQANSSDLSWFHYGYIGTALSLIQTTVTNPFMVVRVKIQSQLSDGSQGHMKSAKEIFRDTWKKGYIRHLYGGWQLRLIRSALVYSLDSYFIHCLDSQAQQ